MSGRSAYSLLTLSLLTLVACAPKSPEESATDTDDVETSDATDAMTDTGEPSTGEPSTGEPVDACEAPDAAAQASVSISFGDWPLVPEGYPDQIRIAADCTVQSATSDGGAIDIELLCSEGELVDKPIGLHLTGPADFGVDILANDKVKLAAYWQADGHHIFTGHWFALHDQNGELLLAGLDYDSATAPKDDLAPLTLASVDGKCEPTCENGESGCSVDQMNTIERLAVGFAHQDGPSVEVLDRSRAQLIAGGRRWDIIVAEAEYWSCLNCGSQYTWILRQADQQ